MTSKYPEKTSDYLVDLTLIHRAKEPLNGQPNKGIDVVSIWLKTACLDFANGIRG